MVTVSAAQLQVFVIVGCFRAAALRRVGGCVEAGGREIVRHEVVDLIAVDDEFDAVADEEDEHHSHQHWCHRDVPLLPFW